MKPLILSLLTGLIFQSAMVFADPQESGLKDTAESKYKVGQMWSYKTRQGEEKSYFIVVKVESHPKLGNIIHIERYFCSQLENQITKECAIASADV